ncbi:MAG: hypothetical protein JWQ14_1998 [Adhaeribacter sp.]|nr:hypothetical protein [Adhaeribacter sp.]
MRVQISDKIPVLNRNRIGKIFSPVLFLVSGAASFCLRGPGRLFLTDPADDPAGFTNIL